MLGSWKTRDSYFWMIERLYLRRFYWYQVQKSTCSKVEAKLWPGNRLRNISLLVLLSYSRQVRWNMHPAEKLWSGLLRIEYVNTHVFCVLPLRKRVR